ncbi:MAG: arginyl-tRNA synthetase [Rhodoglobus sp.]|nr:arginyl-tRNA synthetase [Rhodoglobus sp.]
MRTRLSPLLWAPSIVVLVALAGCVPTDESDPGTTATPTPSATATQVPTPTPTTSPSAGPDAVPLSIPCAELITPDAMYAYSPAFALVDQAPASGSLADRALDYQGTACTWVNESSGETIVISVAQLSDGTLAALRSELDASSTPVTAFGVDGYFDIVGGAGEAQVLSGPYWLTATSPVFGEAADVQDLVDAALSTLD